MARGYTTKREADQKGGRTAPLFSRKGLPGNDAKEGRKKKTWIPCLIRGRKRKKKPCIAGLGARRLKSPLNGGADQESAVWGSYHVKKKEKSIGELSSTRGTMTTVVLEKWICVQGQKKEKNCNIMGSG